MNDVTTPARVCPCTLRRPGAECPCHQETRRGALLLNLGTPDSTSVADVRRYLRQFLSDPYVLDFPRRWDWLRVPLALLIAHFRGPKSAHAYRSIWWEEGSPLKVITERQVRSLQKRLPNGWRVYYAMRYANPSVREALARIVEDGITDLVVVPMYPQWSGPTTGTALEELYREIARLGLRLNVTVRNDWYDDANYIDAQARIIHRFAQDRGLDPSNSFLLYSTHSLPTVYVERGDPYEGHVRRSIDLVNRRLGWPADRTAVAFQSKLGPVRWLEPSTENAVKDLAAKGERNLMVCPISFTADCLETLEEIGMQYGDLFESRSDGGRLHLIPSLNDAEEFISGLVHLVRSGPHRLPAEAAFDEPLLAAGAAIDAPLDELIEDLTMIGISKPATLPAPAQIEVGTISDDAFRRAKRPQHETVGLLRKIAKENGAAGCFLLNTCQRYELYALGVGESHGAIASLLAEDARPAILRGREAWWHLLRTAAGLSSELPGDADVIEQVASAGRIANHAGTLTPAAERLLGAARGIVRRIVDETAWGAHVVPYCKAALSPLIGSLDLDRARMVVAGGSVTSASVLRLLVEEHDVDEERLTVFSRCCGRKRLAKMLQQFIANARHIAVESYDAPQVREHIADADVLFLGIDRREPVLRRAHVETMRDFTRRPLTIIDFNTHGSTEGLDRLEGVRVVCASALDAHVQRHVARMLEDDAFTSAWQEAEARIIAFVSDPAEGKPQAAARPTANGATASGAAANGDVASPRLPIADCRLPTTSLPVIDRAVFEKYTGLSLPRHVAYPMPTWWRDLDEYQPQTIREAAQRDLSLYLHLPFCEKMCKFCACNRTILRKNGHASGSGDRRVERYLAALHEELRWRAEDVGHGGARAVRQIHWGGGTPTYLDCEQMHALHTLTRDLFTITGDAEVSIEIDPRVTSREQLAMLRSLGFNRVSMGVQDFDPIVQEHVGRVQPLAMVRRAVEICRELGFPSINFDLIYGLPYQTVKSVNQAVAHTIDLGADRVAFYHYAQIPDRIANQRKLHHHALPDSTAKLQMLLEAVSAFEAAGYLFIGLDHFARPDERLAQAMANGTINRNFQGMTTGAQLDLVGLGCSAISCFPGEAYLQNLREPDEYAGRIESGRDPAIKGLSLSRDDAIRQFLLLRLYCDARVDADAVSRACGIDFAAYFQHELERLAALEADGLVRIKRNGSFELTFPLGRVLMRNVAAVFDAHLDREAYRVGQAQTFSASA